MSANLTIDTNVLIVADRSAACHRVLNMVMKNPDDYCLFLDRDHKIDREYQEYANAHIKQDPESTIGVFVAWLNQREQGNLLSPRLQSEINTRACFPEEYRASAEAALIGISCKQSDFYFVTTDDQHVAEEEIKRCYRDSKLGPKLHNCLKMAGITLNMLPAQKHDQLRELTRPNITSYGLLLEFLTRHRTELYSVESAPIEVKGGLNWATIDEVMQTLCGMLNSLDGNGYGHILIGVKDGSPHDLRIQGIPLTYEGKKKNSWDELKRIITDRWPLFGPQMPNHVDVEAIIDPDNSDRGVLYLRVKPDPSDRGYVYKKRRYIRVGPRTQTGA